MTGEQTEFREELWGGLADHIRIDEKSSTVVFRGGIEIAIFIYRNMNWEGHLAVLLDAFFRSYELIIGYILNYYGSVI